MRKKLMLGAMLAVLLAVTGASLAFAGGSRHESDGEAPIRREAPARA